MIKVLHESGHDTPILVCDVCGRRINDAATGRALTVPSAVPAGGHYKVMHVHEETCHAMAEGHVGHNAPQEALGTHLLRLLQSLELSPEKLHAFDHTASSAPAGVRTWAM